MEYPFTSLEAHWQSQWEKYRAFEASNESNRPKYYVLDMFPYPSGAGLHVGHPLGYIASDIVARYHRLKGYNVLHPMGFDAFGLPAEQYAIQTGKHPEQTTLENSERYLQQLKMLGLSYDWSRVVNTANPQYYRWTQWIFIQLFEHWYDTRLGKPRPIEALKQHLSQFGTEGLYAAASSYPSLSAEDWQNMDVSSRANFLMHFRLAYRSHATVNWCEGLGTVLANDEVKEGLSERGGYPVERRTLNQWFLRITAYADRLLEDLKDLGWSEAMKEMQRNWIGRSEGLRLSFKLAQVSDAFAEVFTTRPDTLYGVSFLAVAPEHPQLERWMEGNEHKEHVLRWAEAASRKSERERLAEADQVRGLFTGLYALHPLTGNAIPIYVAEYVLAGYGTSTVMGVPAHDARDHKFAKKFNLPILPVVMPNSLEEFDFLASAYEAKEGLIHASEFMNGMQVIEAMAACIHHCETKGIGRREVNFKLRDANFSRQRYWGEPFPIAYSPDGDIRPVSLAELPVTLPPMDDFKPTGKPESPLVKNKEWCTLANGFQRETDTMPGFAGSSWYFLRYMDPLNSNEFAGKEALKYWRNVDLYIGGTEHAVGHLLYARFWNKFLYDLGYIPEHEPFRKLVNQGMIQGRSSFVYRIKGTKTYVSYGLKSQYDTTAHHVDIRWVKNDELSIEQFRTGTPDGQEAQFILEDGKYMCGSEVEKMSKSKLNVVNPDEVVSEYGADTLRMYEMFLGPVEQSKPWSVQGIEGVHKFLRKLWRHCVNREGQFTLQEELPTAAQLKTLHTLLKKVERDISLLSLNTTVSAFMIALSELQQQSCHSRLVFKDFLIALSSFAPHISEELWHRMGETGFVSHAPFPKAEERYLKEDRIQYPVSFNGKVRFNIQVDADTSSEALEAMVRAHADTPKWTGSLSIRKCIVVKGKIINMVLG